MWCAGRVANPHGVLHRQAAGLSLERMQGLLGDRAFLDAVSGRQPYLCAALRSLPMRDPGGAGSQAQERALAAGLLAQVDAQAAGG